MQQSASTRVLSLTTIVSILATCSLMMCGATSFADESPQPEPEKFKKIPYSSLTPEEREILDRGEVSSTSYVLGGVIGTVFGLGIGQAIQGRYVPTGLIITVGEAASIALLEYGMTDCVTETMSYAFANQTHNCSSAALAIGVGGYVGFRIWEIVDVWATPPSINNRYRNLRNHVEGGSTFTMIPAINPQTNGLTGGGLAYQIRF